MSYNVARRTGEIGIRIARGAQRRGVVRTILREVFLLVAAGTAIGLPAALLGSRVVDSFPLGMRPNDPLALAGAVATLASAAILAGYLPLRRASRIDPIAALRQESLPAGKAESLPAKHRGETSRHRLHLPPGGYYQIAGEW
ncbi:MAG TPA: FtsX-like permease family protein [Bryobacteraceae bacterium]|nr:FtsX-like permease family protein [Bryobacteraceae bacterium]